jgi:hypothetical protein
MKYKIIVFLMKFLQLFNFFCTLNLKNFHKNQSLFILFYFIYNNCF